MKETPWERYMWHVAEEMSDEEVLALVERLCQRLTAIRAGMYHTGHTPEAYAKVLPLADAADAYLAQRLKDQHTEDELRLLRAERTKLVIEGNITAEQPL